MIFQLTCSLLYYIFIQHHSVVNRNITVQLNKIKFFKGIFTVQYTKFCIGSVLKQREVLYITDVDYALLCLPDQNIGLTADVTIKRRLLPLQAPDLTIAVYRGLCLSDVEYLKSDRGVSGRSVPLLYGNLFFKFQR